MKKSPPPPLFISKDGLSTFWFCLAVLSVVCTCGYVYRLASTAGLRTQYVMLRSPSVLPLVSELDPAFEAEQMDELTRLATDSLFNKSSVGLDSAARCKRLLSPSAHRWVTDELIAKQEEAFRQASIHQKVEIESIQLVNRADGSGKNSVVKGQLLRVGIHSGEIFNEVWGLRLVLVWQRNDVLRDCASYPHIVDSLSCVETPLASTLRRIDSPSS
jgi:hypothetical protein